MRRIVHLIAPHRSNNHRARLIHPTILTLFIALLFLIHAVFNLVVALHPGVLGTTADISVDRIIDLTNKKRATNNVKALTVSDQLTQAAYRKAQDMFAENYWAHVSPTGKEPWTFIGESGYTYRFAGENLAKDFSTADGVVDAWMNSPSHRDNLLRSDYENIGVAVMNGTINGYSTVVVVQMFGTPLNASTIASVTPSKPDSTISIKQELALNKQQGNVSGVGNDYLQKQNNVALTPQNGAPTAFLSNTSVSSKLPFAINVFGITKAITLMLALIVGAIVCLDVFVVYRSGINRLGSKSWSHLLYLSAVIAMIWFTGQGVIL